MGPKRRVHHREASLITSLVAASAIEPVRSPLGPEAGGMAATDIGNPILNSPYEPPEEHFELGPDGPTGSDHGRRPSESFIPIPVARSEAVSSRPSTSTSPASAGSRTR